MNTKLTFENEHGTYSVSLREESMCVIDVMEKLVIPLLRGAGYHEDSVIEALAEAKVDVA